MKTRLRQMVLDYWGPLVGFALACVIVFIGPRVVLDWFGVNTRAIISHRAFSAFHVIDGDTVGFGGKTYRLVGFDTPEMDTPGSCEAERILAARAKARLSILAAHPTFKLQRVPCAACDAQAEGTPTCNRGRLCAVAFQKGRDVSAIMIRDKLARPFTCTNDGCTRLHGWCGRAI